MNQAVNREHAVIVCKSGWRWVPGVPVAAGRGSLLLKICNVTIRAQT